MRTTQEAMMVDLRHELPPEAGVNPKPKKMGFDTKVKARDAATAAMGPQAVMEFDFECFKSDGRWHWRAFDTPKELSAAERRARGLKWRSKDADQARHEERGAERAAGEGRSWTSPAPMTIDPRSIPAGVSLVDMAKQISGDMAVTVEVAVAKPDTTPDPKTGIPAFLKRESTPEEKEAVRRKLAKTVGPERKIKNPPDADAARRRAEREEAKMAKIPGTPAHAKAARAAKKVAAAKDAAPRAKASTGVRKAVPPPSNGKTKTALVGELLSRKEGCTTADILKATGWPAVSVPAQAKAVGLKLRKIKDGKVTRYYGSK